MNNKLALLIILAIGITQARADLNPPKEKSWKIGHQIQHQGWVVVTDKGDSSITCANLHLGTKKAICSLKEAYLHPYMEPDLMPFVSVGDTVQVFLWHRGEQGFRLEVLSIKVHHARIAVLADMTKPDFLKTRFRFYEAGWRQKRLRLILDTTETAKSTVDSLAFQLIDAEYLSVICGGWQDDGPTCSGSPSGTMTRKPLIEIPRATIDFAH